MSVDIKRAICHESGHVIVALHSGLHVERIAIAHHIGMRPRLLRSQHPDRSHCNIPAPGQGHKDKGCARTWSSLDLAFAISSSSNSISFALDQRFLLSPLSATI